MLGRAAPANGGIFALPCDDFRDVVIAESHVLARYFAGIPEVIRKHGADPFKLISMFDIDPEVFAEREGQIPCARAMPLVEECSFKLDAPLLGLEIAALQDADAYGYVAALCRTAPNLRAALAAFTDYVPLTVSPEGMFDVLESSNTLELRWDCDSELRQNFQGSLHAAAIMVRLLEDIIGGDFRPLCINLPRVGNNNYGAELMESFGCEVRFASPHYGALVISKENADRPLPHSNRFAFWALERPVADLKQRIEGDISTRVREFVRSRIGSVNCTVEECASALSTSVRTLQKHLARMGVSFSMVREIERCELAKTALLRSDISLDELAFQLGYTEQSTFGRAFRRWTSMTPGEFRRSGRRI